MKLRHPEECECEGTGIVSRGGFRITCSKEWITADEAEKRRVEASEQARLKREAAQNREQEAMVCRLYERLVGNKLPPSSAMDLAKQGAAFWFERVDPNRVRGENDQ